jgi:hypothetical protein
LRTVRSPVLSDLQYIDVSNSYCGFNNIVLCRLPSHTSLKLQPCDVSVFGPLKTAYREQVEHLERRGANTVNKEHFVLLYHLAREVALTARNIRSGWSKAGLFPYNASRVLDGMSAPIEGPFALPPPLASSHVQEPLSYQTLTTPTSTEGVHNLYRMLEEKLGVNNAFGDPCLQKFLHATEKAFADRLLLHNENENLLKQNDEKRVRQNAKSTVISQGNAKIMSYADIVEMQQSRAAKSDLKRAKADAKKAKVDAKNTKVDAKMAKAPIKRKRKVEPMISTHEHDVQARQTVEVSSATPGRAPVARIW